MVIGRASWRDRRVLSLQIPWTGVTVFSTVDDGRVSMYGVSGGVLIVLILGVHPQMDPECMDSGMGYGGCTDF